MPWLRLRESLTLVGAREAMIALYVALPVAAAQQLPLLLTRLAKGRAPALIHCTAGKDRTGFVVALLLAALGVPRAAIVEDYLQSSGRWTATVLDASQAMVRAYAGELPEAAVGALMSVDEAYLDASFGMIEERYGGVESYLLAIGATTGELAALRNTLLE